MTTTKPAIDWLKEVEHPELKEILLENTEKWPFKPHTLVKTIWQALGWSFNVKDTDQGLKVWSDCYYTKSWQPALDWIEANRKTNTPSGLIPDATIPTTVQISSILSILNSEASDADKLTQIRNMITDIP